MTHKPIPLSVLTALGLLVLIGWPLLPGNTDLLSRIFGMACFYALLAIAWNISSLTGSISLGHAAFFGLGAYGSTLINHYGSLSPYLSIAAGGALGACYAILWNIFFKRLRGARFALASLAAVEIPKVIIDNWDGVTFGSSGIAGIPGLPPLHFGERVFDPGANLLAQYYLLLFLVCAAGLLHRTLGRSRWGWAIRAVREDETAAASLGIAVAATRARALMLSAALTGLCGGLYAHLIGLIEPALVFSLHFSALPLILSIFGGRFLAFGPILGALILYPLDQLLFHSWLPAGHGLLYGLVVIVTILFFPNGIAAWIKNKAAPACGCRTSE